MVIDERDGDGHAGDRASRSSRSRRATAHPGAHRSPRRGGASRRPRCGRLASMPRAGPRKPAPSSMTASASASAPTRPRMVTTDVPACATALASASWMTRYAPISTSSGGRSARANPSPSTATTTLGLPSSRANAWSAGTRPKSSRIGGWRSMAITRGLRGHFAQRLALCLGVRVALELPDHRPERLQRPIVDVSREPRAFSLRGRERNPLAEGRRQITPTSWGRSRVDRSEHDRQDDAQRCRDERE